MSAVEQITVTSISHSGDLGGSGRMRSRRRFDASMFCSAHALAKTFHAFLPLDQQHCCVWLILHPHSGQSRIVRDDMFEHLVSRVAMSDCTGAP